MKTIKRGSTWCKKEIEEDFNNVNLYGNLSYATLCKLCFTNMILCNNIIDIDEGIYENLEWTPEDNEDWEYPEIFQYYLVNADNCFFEEYKEHFLMSYSEKLDLYVLCVDHFGTSWKYISSGVKIVETEEG